MIKMSVKLLILSFSLALIHASQLSAQNNIKAEEYCDKGEALIQEMKLDEALQYFDKAIKLSPSPKYYCKRGICLMFQSNLEDAMKDFDRALKLDPKYAEAYLFKGSIYQAKEERNQAIEFYSEAIKADPLYADAYLMRGLISGSMGKNDDACRDIKKAVDLGSEKAINQYQKLCIK